MTPEETGNVTEVTITESDLVGEEVTGAVETAGAVDLTTVSQQLDQVTYWQATQASNQWALMGLIIGVVLALVIGRWWR